MYKHGTYGEEMPSGESVVTDFLGTTPVYIGVSPIHQTGEDFTNKINYPVLINSFSQAQKVIGYSDDFSTYNLSEAIYAHFKNNIQPIGPIIVINVFDPNKTKEAGGSASIELVSKVGYLNEDLLLSTVQVEGKVLGRDYKVEYQDSKVKFTALTDIPSPVTVTFTKVLPKTVSKEDIIGSVSSTGEKTGIYAVDYVYGVYNIIPNIILSPTWSKDKEVYEVLNEKCQKISGKWDAIVLSDIDTTSNKNISEAISYKKENGLNSKFTKLFYPMTKLNGKLINLSTLAAVIMQITDKQYSGIPYVSPSNKPSGAEGMFLDENVPILFDFESANVLNANGITTGLSYGGSFKIWGGHMANFYSDAEIAIENISDTSVRMAIYMTNEFQRKFLNQIDQPMNKRLLDNILDETKIWLNGLVTDGIIIKGEITFDNNVNTLNNMILGDFVFDVKITNDPNTKSLTFRVKQSSEGLKELFGGEA